MDDPRKFLVRIDDRFFIGFTSQGKRVPLFVGTPSKAIHLTYEEADEVTQCLRAEHGLDACATDILGRYADLKIIEQALVPTSAADSEAESARTS